MEIANLASARVRQGRSVFEALERVGYDIVPLLSNSDCKRLIEIFYSLQSPAEIEEFHVSMHGADRHYSGEADGHVRAVLGAKLPGYLGEHELVVGNFVVKRPGGRGAVPVHQDWTFVDERRFTSLSIWCPLTDVTPDNGTLHVLPGSHALANFLRGPDVPVPFHGHEEVIRARGTALSLPAGHAVIYNHRLVHWSPENVTDAPRVAANLLLIPAGARLCHVRGARRAGSGELDVYEVDRSYFLDARPWQPPPISCRIGSVDAAVNAPAERALGELLKSAA